MAPLLIDSRDLVKYIIITMFVMVVVFAVGFALGHQRVATFYQVSSVVQSLTLPGHVPVAESDIGSQQPENIAAGEEIDVDSPEAIVSETVIQDNLELPQQAVAKTSRPFVKKRDKTSGLKVTVQDDADTSIQGSDKDYAAENDVVAQQPALSDAAIITAFTSDQISKIKYSIQVGMYGSLQNAENMMMTLRLKRYESYITDFTNKKNETRYNVRFGYFPDKKSAMASLDKFKGDQNGDGYLVRFSADDIVNIADAAVMDQSVNAPVHGDVLESKNKPATTPIDLSQDKISQADVLNDAHTKTN